MVLTPNSWRKISSDAFSGAAICMPNIFSLLFALRAGGVKLRYTGANELKALADQSDFVELCDIFDREIMSQGMGSFRRAGLIAIAEKRG